MKKFIRSRQSLAFLTSDGGWTHDRKLACDFRSVTDALQIVIELKLSEVELYYSYEDPALTCWDFAAQLSVNPPSAPPRSQATPLPESGG